MNLSSLDILEAVEHSLSSIVAKELRSPEARSTLDVVFLGLRELRKREGAELGELANALASGGAIASEIAVALGRGPLHTGQLHGRAEPGNNVSCLNRLNALLDELDQLSKALATARSSGKVPAETAMQMLRQVAVWECEVRNRWRNLLPATSESGRCESAFSASELEKFLASALIPSKSLHVENLERIPGGMSKETYFFDLVTDTDVSPLVVRRADAAPALERGIFNLSQEFALVRRLYELGFTVPEPKWLSGGEFSAAEAFYISERARGRVAGTVFGANQALSEIVLMQLAEKLAQLHSFPIDCFSGYVARYQSTTLLHASADECVAYYLDWWRDWWQDFQRFPSPAETYLFEWLYENLPDAGGPPCLIHGDLGLHNFLHEGDEITAILDWEGSHFGDPAEDLAYARKHVSAHMEWGKFYRHYLKSGGREVDEKSFAYFDCLANARNLIATNKVAARARNRGLTGDIKDLYLALEFIPEFMNTAIKNTA